MSENREQVVRLLKETLQATREFKDIIFMELEEYHGNEIVHIVFDCGKVIDVNVTADSGSAIIQDVWKTIYR